MAQLNSRGTLTRTRWDYFEQTNGWAFVQGSVASGNIGCWFANNSSGALSLDIYNVTWAASVAMPWSVVVLLPPFVLTPITPTLSELHATQPDARAPAGVVGMYVNSASPFFTMYNYVNQSNFQSIAPVGGMCWLTLPPGWGIAVGGIGPVGGASMSMSVWFQEVLDNIPPAR